MAALEAAAAGLEPPGLAWVFASFASAKRKARPGDGALAPRAQGDRHAARGGAAAARPGHAAAALDRRLTPAQAGRRPPKRRASPRVNSAAAVPHVIADTTGSLKSVPLSTACRNASANARYARRWTHSHSSLLIRRFR